ncbi:hypothetical protein FOG50_00297 [Hanseniaspora uvarum]|uniref:Endoplasmic reticulum vesicle protein 25 n=1 Tax=Hanseniaspora uvarum TaxID=29833 RepID=A0A1E5R703_HANUV|nr:hypothetical protein FOG48_01105 [Hanseniaspora uvarum]KAF0278844.1 hypothetical protein FOG50_00297 [Hanseniaspora uvarum]OEJ82690.1 Endoplasmic reticulum vesicle protein 25 [Hanseniaspora uvarum]GMM42152.1 Erv25 protein [Hanseniaspora uvarum]
MKYTLQFLFALSSILTLLQGLRFELGESKEPYCIRDFATPGQLIVVDVVTDDANSGKEAQLDMFIRDTAGNEYRKKKDIFGDLKVAFTCPDNGIVAFDVCFEHTIPYSTSKKSYRNSANSPSLIRFVELDIEMGSQARDWNKIQAVEKLKPVEVDLRRIEELTDEIVDELQFLKSREERLRDTNESTNKRVKFFSIAIIILLLVLGTWQVSYLRSFFKSKNII